MVSKYDIFARDVTFVLLRIIFVASYFLNRSNHIGVNNSSFNLANWAVVCQGASVIITVASQQEGPGFKAAS